jgi:hypothetical protein
MPLKRIFTPAAIDDARERYEETDEPVAEIAADLEIEVGTLYRYMKKWGWRLRSARAPQDLPPILREVAAVRAEVGAPEAPAQGTADDIAARLERAIRTQLAAVERAQARRGGAGRSPQDAERIARILAVLARALKEAQRLRAPAASVTDDDDDFPADIDELRRELARRIHAFVESRTDRALRGPGEPAGGDGPAA